MRGTRMVDISLTKSLRSTVSTLNMVNRELANASDRLTSGVKVQSALDDPSAFITAKNLSGHAATLDKYLERLTQGLGVINSANNGITSISDTINNLKGVVTRASASHNAFERADLAKEYNTLLQQIVDTAKDASYGGKNLLLGEGNDITLYLSADQSESLTVKAVDFTDLPNTLGLNKLDEGKFGVFETKLKDVAGTQLKPTNLLTETGSFVAGDVVSVKDGSGNIVASLAVKDTTTITDFLTTLNQPDAGMRASLDAGGVLKVESASNFTIDKATPTVIAPTSKPPASSTVTLTDGSSNPLTGTSLLTDSSQFQVGDVIKIKVGDSVIKSMTVTATSTVADLQNAFTSSNLDTSASLDASGNFTVNAATGFSFVSERPTNYATLTATASSWLDRTKAEDTQQVVTDSRKAAQKHASNIGLSLTLLQSRANYIQSFSDVLGATAESMRASDKDEEAAIMLALNTQQQLAISSFSITQTADNGILRLLGSKVG